jgi:hypothetical protein
MDKYIMACVNRSRKKDSIKFPRRDRTLVATALHKMKLRYFEYIEINNPLFTDRAGVVKGGLQWVDYIVRGTDGKLFAIEFYPKWPGNGRPHKYQINWMNEKVEYLKGRGVPTLIINRGETSQDYWMRIYVFLHALKRGR